MTCNDGPFRYKGSICNTRSYDNRNLNKYILSTNGSAGKNLWPGIADAINNYNYIGKELQNELTLWKGMITESRSMALT